MRSNPQKRLVSLKRVIPGLQYDLVYGTTRNFTKTVLYTHAQPYLLAGPAAALQEVERELNKRGLGVKIFDAFRPFSVTCHIWQLVPDTRYAANPAKGSNHNRGLAVDLTIIDLATGKELDMGTGFDNFTDTAHHDFAFLPANVLNNRKMLKQAMWKHGFSSIPTEWWHYSRRTKDGYEVIDVDFDDLKDLIKE
jgi:D-alanyl-D-alanine dipeptidase